MVSRPGWAKLVEYAAGFKKGTHIRAEGELSSSEYETDGGVKVRTCVIVAFSMFTSVPASAPRHQIVGPDAATAVADGRSRNP